jgi:hypothetical protein
MKAGDEADVTGFGRCKVLRQFPFNSNTGAQIYEVLTPGGIKLPVNAKFATPVKEAAR